MEKRKYVKPRFEVIKVEMGYLLGNSGRQGTPGNRLIPEEPGEKIPNSSKEYNFNEEEYDDFGMWNE